MPYEGEFAAYRALQRIAETDRVKQLLSRSRIYTPSASEPACTPSSPPAVEESLPEFIIAIDGSNQEVSVESGYPGAQIGYLTVASVLIDLTAVNELDSKRPADPISFRETEESTTIDAALPGSNVVTRTHKSARVAFREELYGIFHDCIVDTQDRIPLLDTYEILLAYKPESHLQSCPYEDLGCTEKFMVGPGISECCCQERRSIWSTDALRIHERFHDEGTNGEAFGEVMQVLEIVFLVHILRACERQKLLQHAHRLAFFIDGPLAVFGHPAWLSNAISIELKRINSEARKFTDRDIIIIGVEKSGAFVTHFDTIDSLDKLGNCRFSPCTYFLPTDLYIKRRIVYSDSQKRYGQDTYFGRKFFYKTRSEARIVASIPFLSEEQDTIDSDDVSLYPSFDTTCALLDKLVSCRFSNALAPIVSAHAQAAIPLHLGAKVLEQLANALMRNS